MKNTIDQNRPQREPDQELLDTCYEMSLRLLRTNCTAEGILASTHSKKAVERHYASIFGRDAGICALGMVATGESDLMQYARAGLMTLAQHQAPNGQIPKFVKAVSGEADFWYTGCIDATLWWLIAVSWFDRSLPGSLLDLELERRIKLALRWLECQEHQIWFLLQQNEASDWADIMPRSGFVLYTNALWFWVKKLYGIPTARWTRDYVNLLLSPFGNAVPEQRRARLLMHYIRNRSKPTPFYLSFVNFSSWGEEIDIFGNILAHLTGLGDASAGNKMITAVLAMQANSPFPVRVVGNPIRPESELWRLYMQRHRQNLPWQYHNGGIWPFAGGFWVMLLARLGHDKLAWIELEKLAAANKLSDWGFREWFHGASGEPQGMTGQSWNAALFILAYRALSDKTRFII